MDLDLHVADSFFALPAFFAHLVQFADAGFAASAASFDSGAHPDFFLSQPLVEQCLMLSFNFERRFFPQEERRVIARPIEQPATIDFDDSRREFSQEDSVVRDENQRPAVTHQELFQPRDRFDVQVVGRLVQQQQVRLTDQCLSQQHAAFHPR